MCQQDPKFCACCGEPLTRNDYTVRTLVRQIECRNEGCPAYFKTTIVEGYQGMIERFGLMDRVRYDTYTGQVLEF